MEYFIVVWRRPRVKSVGPVRHDHGDCAMFFNEGEIIREIEDYGIEPEAIVQMVSDNARNWRAHPYELNMAQVRRDAMADAWQQKPRFGV